MSVLLLSFAAVGGRLLLQEKTPLKGRGVTGQKNFVYLKSASNFWPL